MPVYRIVDEQVFSQTEYQAHAEDIARHLRLRLQGEARSPLPLSGGRVVGLTAPTAATPGATPFTPVGLNKPLTVEIRDVFTGRYPETGLFSTNADLAVVSGVKSYAAFEASARAVNYIKQKAAAHRHLVQSAFDMGTPIIMNSPAITADSLALTVEFAVASFPKELVDYLGTAFESLAKLPILMPYAGYLLGAHSVIKLAGNLGDALFGHKVFSFNDSLNFDRPGTEQVTADFRVLCNSGLDAANYKYKEGKGLVDAAGTPYDGDEPYVVISVDGSSRDDLKGFTPSVATAAILQKFFQLKDGAEAGVDALVQGIQLGSDLKYRQQAIDLRRKIDSLAVGDEKAAAQSRYQALVNNILEQALKP